MTISTLKNSPNGEVTHGEHRRKTNEVVMKVNELSNQRELTVTNDMALFEISNSQPIVLTGNVLTKIMPDLVTAKMLIDDDINDFLTINAEEQTFSFKSTGKAEHLKAFEVTLHIIGSGNWSNGSYAQFSRDGLSSPILSSPGGNGMPLIINASSDSYPLDFYNENDEKVNIRNDNFYFELFSDVPKTIEAKQLQIRMRFIVTEILVVQNANTN